MLSVGREDYREDAIRVEEEGGAEGAGGSRNGDSSSATRGKKGKGGKNRSSSMPIGNGASVTTSSEACDDARITELAAKAVLDIKTIAERLAKEGRVVLVAGIVPGREETGALLDLAREKNRLLLEWLDSLEKERKAAASSDGSGSASGAKAAGSIMAGPFLDRRPEFRRQWRDIYCFDRYHLSSHGYRMWAKAWMESLAPHMTKVEWRGFKQVLSGKEKRA